VKNIYIILQQIYSGNCASDFLRIARGLLKILQKSTFWSLFPRKQCSIVFTLCKKIFTFRDIYIYWLFDQVPRSPKVMNRLLCYYISQSCKLLNMVRFWRTLFMLHYLISAVFCCHDFLHLHAGIKQPIMNHAAKKL